ncbi:MAG: SIMPL domain-containing protein [Hydrogenovibrio sp.]|uniref:SIMPL domain-containing protein n=1 Tax=Hydrogenovibrio sp. TaxID=2065821 RepID=UPI00286FF495|nr:SIMPL domain-containing protein [Hydrogenovibrio sp.]MDR9499176.1 SIMPL domain-containing protein [Hydrogenovibrio sp.]
MPMKRIARTGVVLSLLSTSLLWTVWAGASSAQHEPHRVHFEASVTETVMPDTFVVTLRANEEGKDPTQVSREINRRMQRALNQLQSFDAIRVQTERYRVNPIYDRHQSISHWRGQQTLRLTTSDPEQLGKLLPKLEDSLQYQHQTYQLSPALRQQTQAQLLAKATEHYQQKAKTLAKLLGQGAYRLIETHIAPIQDPSPRPMLSRTTSQSSAPDSAPPAIQADKVTLTQTLRGVLALQE